jgi:hypothetical protein
MTIGPAKSAMLGGSCGFGALKGQKNISDLRRFTVRFTPPREWLEALHYQSINCDLLPKEGPNP